MRRTVLWPAAALAAALALGDAAAWPIQGLFRHFRPEIEDRIASYRTNKPHVQGATLIAAE